MKKDEIKDLRRQCNVLTEQSAELEHTRVELRKAQHKAEELKADLERRHDAER